MYLAPKSSSCFLVPHSSTPIEMNESFEMAGVMLMIPTCQPKDDPMLAMALTTLNPGDIPESLRSVATVP